jgi:hypothetical protein
MMLVAASPSAHAYLDPGTGSMALQLLIAGILGALFTIKMWWYRIKFFFARILGKQRDVPRDPGPEPNAPSEDKRQSP